MLGYNMHVINYIWLITLHFIFLLPCSNPKAFAYVMNMLFGYHGPTLLNNYYW